jgi:hypothetical protein
MLEVADDGNRIDVASAASGVLAGVDCVIGKQVYALLTRSGTTEAKALIHKPASDSRSVISERGGATTLL